MNQYLSWLLSIDCGGALYVPPTALMVSYALTGASIIVLRWTIGLRYFPDVFAAEKKAGRELLGEALNKSFFRFLICALNILGFTALSTTIGPVLEELLYRGVVLWFVSKGFVLIAVCLAVFSAIVFGLSHRFDLIQKSNRQAVLIGIGGLMYGISVVATSSLWPAIFAHAGWNLSCALLSLIYDKKQIGALICAAQR